MGVERHISIAEDGSLYGDKVALFYEGADGQRITFYCDPDSLYTLLHAAIVKMAAGGIDEKNPPPGVTQEMAGMRKRLAGLMKVGVKGLLLMYGDQILTVILGKAHEKPKKGDDLLDWYTDIFTRIGIGYLMKQDTVLIGKAVEGESDVISIDEINTRPLTRPEQQPAGA